MNKIIKQLLVLLFWLLLWFILAAFINEDLIFPSPIIVFKYLFELIKTKEFWYACLSSIFRITLGYILGVLIAILLSLISISNNYIKDLLSPMIKLIRSTPVASFSILALLWLAKDHVAILISMMMAIPIIYQNIIEEFNAVDNLLIEMADAYKVNLKDKIRKIYYPSIKPAFLASISTTIGLAWKAGIAAEVISLPKSAIGSNLYYSKVYLETPQLFAWTLVVIILSSLIEKIIRFILKRGQYEN